MKKTILLTGATDGIGKLLAYKLALDGHILYLHGRNEQKLLDLISEIQKQSNNTQIYSCVADFSSLESVKAMSQKLGEETAKIDVLINNAGVYMSKIAKEAEGIDIRFIVNYLAPYVLTNEVLPLLKKSESPRIINLSSAAQSSVSLDVMQGKTQVSEGEAYAQSKLALTMWSFDIASKNPDIMVIAVNPGSYLNTKMVHDAFGQHQSSADKGRDILYDLALSEKYINDTGKYFDNDIGSFGKAHSDAYNNDKIEELMSVTEKVIELYT